MKDTWLSRTKKYWHDDSAVSKVYRQVRRQASTHFNSMTPTSKPQDFQHTSATPESLDVEPQDDEPVNSSPPISCEQRSLEDAKENTCLLDLPNEVLDHIVSHLNQYCGYESHQNAIALSMSCRRLRALCAPHVFRYQQIKLPGKKLSRDKHSISLEARASENGVISGALEKLKLIHRKGGRGADIDHIQPLTRALNNCSRLRTIYLDPPTTQIASLLQSLNHKSLHIILDFRLINSDFPQLAKLVSESSFKWSLATSSSPAAYEILESVLSRQAKALCIDTMCLQQHRKLPETAQSHSSLEELHILRHNNEEKKTHPRVLSTTSMIVQICDTMPRFSALRRLRVEGSRMIEEMLKILPSLQTIEQLSMYSSCRSTFHPDCNFDEKLFMTPTTDGPWLQLPRLRQLDIGYICRHIRIEQLVPKGLLGLRVEFYSPNEQFTHDDMQWLARNCPDLERLEINVNISQATALLKPLEAFRSLRKVRLFPSYWQNGRFVAQPLPSIDWSIQLFDCLAGICPRLTILIICISNGEYPLRLVSRLEPAQRPLKFVVEKSGHTNSVRLRYGFADSREMVQRVFNSGQANPREVVSVSPELFFDDLCGEWTIRRYEVLYIGDQAWLMTADGQRYLDEIEAGSFLGDNGSWSLAQSGDRDR